MKKMLIIVAILFIITTIIELLLNSYKKSIQNKLVELLSQKKFEEFDGLIEDKKTRFFVPINNYHILKMNEAIIKQKNSDVILELDKLNELKLSEDQKSFIYCRAFSYFLTINDKNNINKYYTLVLDLKDSPSKKYVMMVYNTLIEKGHKYIEEATQMLNNATDEDKYNLITLLSQMYFNKGDDEKAKEYSLMIKGD